MKTCTGFLAIFSLSTVVKTQTLNSLQPPFKVKSEDPNVRIYFKYPDTSQTGSSILQRGNLQYSVQDINNNLLGRNAGANSAIDRKPIVIRYSKKDIDDAKNQLQRSSSSGEGFQFGRNPNDVRNFFVGKDQNAYNIYGKGRQFTANDAKGETILVRRIISKNKQKETVENRIIRGEKQKQDLLSLIVRRLIGGIGSKSKLIRIDESDDQVTISAFSNVDQMSSRSEAMASQKAPLKLLIIEGNPLVVDDKLLGRNVGGTYTIPTTGNLIIGAQSQKVEQYSMPKANLGKELEVKNKNCTENMNAEANDAKEPNAEIMRDMSQDTNVNNNAKPNTKLVEKLTSEQLYNVNQFDNIINDDKLKDETISLAINVKGKEGKENIEDIGVISADNDSKYSKEFKNFVNYLYKSPRSVDDIAKTQ